MTEPTANQPVPVPSTLFNAVGSALSQVFTAIGKPRPYFSQRQAVAGAIWAEINNWPIPEPTIAAAFGQKARPDTDVPVMSFDDFRNVILSTTDYIARNLASPGADIEFSDVVLAEWYADYVNGHDLWMSGFSAGQAAAAGDAGARNTKALGLIDAWLSDESPTDDERQRSIWRGIREIRSALSRCAHVKLDCSPVDGDVWYTNWKCEDCGRGMVVLAGLTVDGARKALDGEES
ncbi:hypothetical protein B7C42_01626 [Nocardia cerradoensis]|uniref:Uncharacterized protein n=1 Tax=Nocardia cerradoensis TaxID=85688 RepID=A0A231HCX8_9NOCA|nr:hypothetical protein [Nocardia cerradoensis]OXR46652.1 hypothetical protein B7C42_01626 [Nocardia cerradoensis]